MKCEHLDFSADVQVARIENVGRFMADVRIKCTHCGEPFRFLGLPAGIDLEGAAVSVDGYEARLAIGTKETVANILESDSITSFTVRKER